MNDLSSCREPVTLSSLWADTIAAGFTMASEPLTGSFLRTLATLKPSGRFLELGSGTGLSTAWILDGMDAKSRLITVDYEEKFLSVLHKHLGHDTRMEVVCADGDDFLRSLVGQKFDFIFADTWSGKYRLLEEALDLLPSSGIYFIDDMLPQANWPEGHDAKVADLLVKLENRNDLHITQFSWASGIVLAVKK